MAARDHHHVAHVRLGLVGEEVADAELHERRGRAELAELVRTGAVLVPLSAGESGRRLRPRGCDPQEARDRCQKGGQKQERSVTRGGCGAIGRAGDESLRAFLKRLNDAQASARGVWGPRDTYGYAYGLLQKTLDDPSYGKLRDAVRRFAIETIPLEPGTDVLGALAEILGLDA